MPETSVFGIVQCAECNELRPVLDPWTPKDSRRVYRCTVCIERHYPDGRPVYKPVHVVYFEHPMTLAYFKNAFKLRLKKKGTPIGKTKNNTE